MSRAQYVLAGVAILVGVLLTILFTSKQQPFNVIVISVDSLRADHMGVYGYARDTTPNIDRWAKGGTVFTNYYATSYLTPISEGSVQTGVQPFTSSIINFATVGKTSVPLLAEVLKDHGYQTAAFGSSPEFSVNEALLQTFKRGFDTFEPYAQPVGAQKIVNTFRTARFPIDQSIEWLTKHADKPFYLWMPLGGVHAPYFDDAAQHFADPEYYGFLRPVHFDEFKTLYGYLYKDAQYKPQAGFPAPVVGTVTPRDTKYITDRYDDGVLATDALVGELFAYLERSGLARSTIVVFESEHGESLGERGYVWHYDIYSDTTHAPLIIKVPSVSGSTRTSLASGVDVMPTILTLLGLPAPRTDGVPILAYSKATTSRTSAFMTRTPLWELVTQDEDFARVDAQHHYYDAAVRTDEWKLIHRTARDAEYRYGWWGKLTGTPIMRPEYELYDVVHDPTEEHDVYTEHQHDSAVVALQKQLAEYEANIAAQKVGTTTLPVQPYF